MGTLIKCLQCPSYVKHELYLKLQKPTEFVQKGKANNHNTVNEAGGMFP